MAWKNGKARPKKKVKGKVKVKGKIISVGLFINKETEIINSEAIIRILNIVQMCLFRYSVILILALLYFLSFINIFLDSLW